MFSEISSAVMLAGAGQYDSVYMLNYQGESVFVLKK